MASSDIARLLVLAGLWGGSFIFIRVAVVEMAPFWLAFSRVALAFLALFVLALAQRSVPRVRAHWRDYIVVGVVNSALPFVLYAFAEQYINASTAAILNATSPFFSALVGAVSLKQSLTLRQIAGMGLGFAGVVWLVGWHSADLTHTMLLAVLACLGAALCYAIGGIYTKLRLSAVSAATIALYSQLAAAIVLAPPAMVVPPPKPSLLVLANVLALAIASTAYAYRLYFRLIANVGPTRALTVTFLIPLFGVLWGVLFLREPLSSAMVVGGVLILAGTWIATRATRPRLPADAGRDSDQLGRRTQHLRP